MLGFGKDRARLRALEDEIESLKESLRASEDAERRVSAVFQSLAEGVVVIDPDKKILLANPALARAVSLTSEAVVGRAYWEVFRDAALNEMIGKALTERIAIEKEHEFPLSDATFQVRLSPVFGGGEFLGVAAVFYEVTRLKRLEKSRVEFVANVSHELKTPLTSILGFVETLKEGAIDDKENRGRFLSIIESHARKLHRLIEDLLHLSSIESGNEAPRRESVDAEELWRELLETFDPAIRAKEIKVAAEFQEKPFRVQADPSALEEILSNLLDNALKYTGPGGSVTLAASRDGKFDRLELRDTGIGIPEADLPRIFERFYRVEKSRSRESGGSGLGLSIVKHLAERHGGRVEASSSGKGSVFTLFLPSQTS